MTFTLLTFTVTPSSDANGTISPNTAQTVNYGSSLTFTATPNSGYAVNTWSLDGTVIQTGGNTYTLTNITAGNTIRVTFSQLLVSAVVLSVLPASPQWLNTIIKLTATATDNGGQVEYQFRVGYADSAGWHWTNLTAGYTTTASCVWTPTMADSYTLVVWAREVGHTANYDQFALDSYQVTIPPLTAVALAVTPAAPRPCNTPIT